MSLKAKLKILLYALYTEFELLLKLNLKRDKNNYIIINT